MLQIYRVEHSTTRVGPFQTLDEFTQTLAEKANALSDLKSPGDDGLPLGQLPFCFVFGCSDIEHLKRWFLLGDTPEENTRIIQLLSQKGFQLAEYLAESDDYDVSASGMQVAFNASACRMEGLVQFHDLDCLLAERFAGQ